MPCRSNTAYRLADPEGLEFIGIRDYFGDMSVCLVEWPEWGSGALPSADLVINIAQEGRGRHVAWANGAESGQGRGVLARMLAESGV